MARIDVEHASLTYPNGTKAISDATLAVDDGEFVALLGPSGSGKTTLLRMVAGFLTPQEGRILIGGSEVASAQAWVPPEKRRLGMVFQQHAIWPHWDVARNVDYPMRLAGIDTARRDRRVGELLELVGLPGTARRNPATLSGGQQQRVALARALALDPQALLLDEALSALDEPLRASLRAEIKQLADEAHLTVLHVTHDRDEALALADRVVVLRDGVIEQVGTPADVVDAPATAFVAGFMGDATLLPATVQGDRVVVEGVDLRLPLDRVERVGEGGKGQLALLPARLAVTRDDDGDAVVASSMFTREGSLLKVDAGDVRLTVRTRGERYERGDRVSLDVEHGLFYAG